MQIEISTKFLIQITSNQLYENSFSQLFVNRFHFFSELSVWLKVDGEKTLSFFDMRKRNKIN